jgi:tetratricopeptide (TPR) repeat protein
MMRKLLSLALAGLMVAISLPAALAATPGAAELLATGHADEALAALHSQLQSAPSDAEAYILLLRTYFGLHRWDEAVAAGQQAVVLDPNNSHYHLWLGRAYGEKAESSPWFQALLYARKTHAEFAKAVALNGKNIDARSDLAEYYVEAPPFLGGSKEKAQAEANQLRLLGDEGTALWIQAKIAEAEKNYKLAEQKLRAAIAASKGNPEAMINLASFYRRRDRMEDMEKMIDQAVQAASGTPRSNVLLESAELLYRAGRNFTGALKLVRNYISSPRHSEDAPVFQAYYLLGSLLEKQGDKQAAAEQYRTALSLASGFEPAQTALKRLQ